MVYPQLTSYELMKYNKIIMKTVWDYLYNTIPNIQLSANLDDYTFLAKIGSIRDWTKDCVICLDEKTGHVCDCGHSEIVIFRGCGHSMCRHPCFDEYKTKHNTCPICKTKITKVFDNNNIWFPSESINKIVNIKEMIKKFHIL